MRRLALKNATAHRQRGRERKGRGPRAAQIFNKHRKLYRLTAADPIAEDTAVDVNALMRVAAKEAALLADSGEVTVRVTPLNEGYSIAGDEKQLRRAMANLLSSACAFAPAGSEVQILAEIAAHKVTIDVFDAGPPILDDETALLFDGFLKIAQSDGERVGGLGSLIAKAIVDRHHGEIGVVNLEKAIKFHSPCPSAKRRAKKKSADRLASTPLNLQNFEKLLMVEPSGIEPLTSTMPL